MTHKVMISGPQLQYLELIRVALSEGDHEQRMRAINNVKHEVRMNLLELLVAKGEANGISALSNAEFSQEMAKAAIEAQEATREFSQTERRYEGVNGRGNERKLNVAEHIGKLVFLSIREGKFHGVHSEIGILEKVRHDAKLYKISGARDDDTLRKIWKTYRGVVHLGIAMEFYEDTPNWRPEVLGVAEEIRCALSQNCPRNHKEPYVDPEDQISFILVQ